MDSVLHLFVSSSVVGSQLLHCKFDGDLLWKNVS